MGAGVRVVLAALIAVLVMMPGHSAPAAPMTVNIDDSTAQEIDRLLALRSGAGTTGESIERMSRQFLGTPYVANTLIGSPTQPEQLVIDFQRVDCFTYLDYVEALRKSADRDQFVTNLIDTRYVDDEVDFLHRKHFFTDWANTTNAPATDITGTVSDAAVTVVKRLNAKADGGQYVPGLPGVDRAVTYVPSVAVNDAAVSRLQTGDYLGAYTNVAGLDVTHVGIFVVTASGPVFRNASSIPGVDAVVDTPLADYLASVPGIVVLRAR